jgi:hypothetical protein
MSRQIGNPLNLERLSGELYFKPQGEAGYIGLGNVVMFKESPETETVSGFFNTRAATQREVRRDTKSTTMKWELTFNERTPDVEALLLFGKKGAELTQAAVTGATDAELTGVAPGRFYDIGKLSLHTVTAKDDADAALTVGEWVDGEIVPADADVVIDPALGQAYINPAGTVADGDDITVTYKANEVTLDQITEIGKHVKRLGAFRLAAFDGSSDPVRKLIEFDGQLVPKERGENKTDGFNEFGFEVIATGDVSARIA